MRSVSGEARCASLAGGDGARARHLPQRWRGHAPAAWRRGAAGAKVAAHCSSSILETATRPKCSARSSARRRRGRPCRWRHAHPRAPCPLPMAAQVRAAAAGAAARASGAFSSGWPSRTAQRLSSCAPWVAPFRVCVFAVFVTVHTCVTVTHKSQPRTGHTRMPRPSSSLLHACRLPNAPASRLHGYTRPAFLPLSLRARRAPIQLCAALPLYRQHTQLLTPRAPYDPWAAAWYPRWAQAVRAAIWAATGRHWGRASPLVKAA